MTTYAPPRHAPPRARPRGGRARPPAPAKAPATRRRPPAIEPKLRDRRVAVLREQGRRRLRRLGLVVTLLALVAVAVGVVFSPLLDVDRIVVRGTTGTRTAEVLGALGVERGDALALVDTGTAADQVERLPWVDRARVARHFPGRLTVDVTPRVPVAWTAVADGTIHLVDRRGVVLATAPAAPPGVPQLGIPGVTAPRLIPTAARVAAALTPALRANVTLVVIVDGQAYLALAGTEIRLGAPVDVAAKVGAAEAVLGSLAGVAPTYIDVRVPSAPVTG